MCPLYICQCTLGEIPKSVISQKRGKHGCKLVKYCQIPFYGEEYFLVRSVNKSVCSSPSSVDSPANHAQTLYSKASLRLCVVAGWEEEKGKLSMMGRVLG